MMKKKLLIVTVTIYVWVGGKENECTFVINASPRDKLLRMLRVTFLESNRDIQYRQLN